MKPYAVSILTFIAVFSLAGFASASTTVSFYEGDGGLYSATHGADIPPTGSVNNGSGQTMSANVILVGSGYLLDKTCYVRFPDIFGPNLGQIPPGATIEAASLQLYPLVASAYDAILYRVTSAWDENTITGDTKPTSAPGSVGTLPVLINPSGFRTANVKTV